MRISLLLTLWDLGVLLHHSMEQYASLCEHNLLNFMVLFLSLLTLSFACCLTQKIVFLNISLGIMQFLKWLIGNDSATE